MKTLTMAACVLIAVSATLVLGGCASTKYAPQPNEELYGTWTNAQATNVLSTHKVVLGSDKLEYYYHVDDSSPMTVGTLVLASKWKDSEGNIWYKGTTKFKSGTFYGEIQTGLFKLSKSSTVLELEWQLVGDENSTDFPTQIEPEGRECLTLYRMGG